METLITVIMPVYNGEKYLREAIESILNQSYTGFEFIIVDDASTVPIVEIVSSYTDSRIVYIRNERNLGNNSARNVAMRIAKGRYIAMMDADDIARPERLEKQVAYLESHPDVLAVGADRIHIPLNVIDRKAHTYEEIMLYLLNDNCFVHSSLTLRTEALKSINGYNDSYRYSSDYDAVCRLALIGKVVILDEVLVTYRFHTGQISHAHGREQKMIADEIRRHYQVAFIRRFKSIGQQPASEAEVSHPFVGNIICLYTYARYTQDAALAEHADHLLDNLIQNVSVLLPVCLYRGLLGIGCGMIYILRNRLAEGDEDEILGEIDNTLFCKFDAMGNENRGISQDWRTYLQLRLSGTRSQDVKSRIQRMLAVC